MNFFDRMERYFRGVVAALQGHAEGAAFLGHKGDIGDAREGAYLQVLQSHAPAKCSVFKGGFVFDSDGKESGQIDVLVATDTVPRFNLNNPDERGKSSSHIEGTLATISVKSDLTKPMLIDALSNIASIPPTRPAFGRGMMSPQVPNYSDWPFKAIVAYSGTDSKTVLEHIHEYYSTHRVPLERRPQLIHVVNQYCIFRQEPAIELRKDKDGFHTHADYTRFSVVDVEPDMLGLCSVLNAVQQMAQHVSKIDLTYEDLFVNFYARFLPPDDRKTP